MSPMMPDTEETLTACVLTPPGRGAVAVIGLRGDPSIIDRHFKAVNGLPARQQQLRRICYGQWGTDHPEDVIFVRRSERNAEVHCHGGPAAVQRIISALASSNAAVVSGNTWLDGQCSRLERQSYQALTRPTTQRTAHHVLAQMRNLPQFAEKLQAASDSQAVEMLQNALAFQRFGIHLTQPWSVVLCGRPNVGKSSLVNALVGYTRTVVFDQPGTTRDVVAVETAFDGWPFELSDTAGLRNADAELESRGIARARERLISADLVIVVLDAVAGIQEDDQQLIADWPEAIHVVNKSDLVASTSLDCEFAAAAPLCAVSAVTRDGLDALIARIVERLVPHVPGFDDVYPVTPEQGTILARLKTHLESRNRSAFDAELARWTLR